MENSLKQIYMYALGALIVIGYFAVLVFIINKGVYESTINLAIGALIAAFGTIVGYFYGSSKGSSDKNDLLNKNSNEPKSKG
jgi:hypothetical protein